MPLNDEDRFAAEVQDVFNDADAPPGRTEIGSDVMTPWDAFQSEPIRVGDDGFSDGIALGMDGVSDGEAVGYQTEIGAKQKAAVVAVIKKARDNRQPAPKMRAVAVETPLRDDLDEWALTDTFVGAAAVTGAPDPFPLLSKLMLRFGAGSEPRIVRVDTMRTYQGYRVDSSPELSELRASVEELREKLDAHTRDPHAHASDVDAFDAFEELDVLGAEVDAVERGKRVDLWLPRRFEGKVAAWREGDFVCASIALPGADGEVRVCTSLEPIKKCVAEMARHASEAGVSASTVVGMIPGMGVVLGAGTAIKEMAAAAPALLSRPEAAHHEPFVVRIEPKAAPALCALAALATMCRAGDTAACREWTQLAELAPAQVRQAMSEALVLVKASSNVTPISRAARRKAA